MKKAKLKIRKATAVILATTMLLSMGPVSLTASATEIDNISSVSTTSGDFEYNVMIDGTVEITKYMGSATDIVIPDSLNGCVVTGIGICAFRGNKNIKNVVLPNSITYIGVQAFQDCDNLIEVVIPKGVKKIDIYAFDRCDNLAKVIIPEGVEIIGSLAFTRCNLKSITIPKSVNTIGEYALGYNNLYGDEKLFDPVKIDGFIIYGYKGTAAETYATENDITFMVLDDSEDLHLLGDVNSDSVVNITDATEISKHLAELINLDSDMLKYADVNRDGAVSIMDATEIQKKLAGLI